MTIKLNTPFTLQNGTTIKNRLVKSAMSEQLGNKDHNPRQELLHLYKTWANGGIGLAMTGNIMIDRTALGEPKNVVLDDKSDLSLFRKWAEEGTANNTHLWPQLNHPGKQIPSLICKEPVAPSAIPLTGGLEKGFNTPRELTQNEIWEVIAAFAKGAELAKQSGFTGVQIHGAHGYLVSQFLSPRHNHRKDQWGGTPKNRMRFAIEVYRAIRAATGPDFPIGIKMNSADFMHDGLTEEESVEAMKALSTEGIDLIEISGGTYESPSMVGYKMRETTRKREAYFLAFAEKVREHLNTPLVVTGGFRSAPVMLNALNSNALDFIGLARPLAMDTDFPNQLINNPETSIHLRNLTTGIKAIDNLGMLNITWYEHQLERIGKGKKPKPGMSEWKSLLKTVWDNGKYAFQQRRA